MPTVAQRDAAANAPVLSVGAEGGTVSLLQKALSEAGSQCNADGDFHSKTQDAVKAFQKAKGLSADGAVGPLTWLALLQAAPKALAGGLPVSVPPGCYRIGRTADGTPMYTQGDARWGKLAVGTGADIAAVGCALSCLAMTLSFRLGRDVRPDELDRVFTNEKAYDNGDNIDWARAAAAIEKVYGLALRLDRQKNVSGALIARRFGEELKKHHQMLLNVDHSGGNAPNHWVLGQCKEGNEYVIIDPAYGNEHRYQLTGGSFVASNAYYKGAAPVALGYTAVD